MKLFTDYKTDIVIQNALRSQLGKDVTVITIAHRLQTVMDADKIVSQLSFKPESPLTPRSLQLVLDSGRIVSTLGLAACFSSSLITIFGMTG